MMGIGRASGEDRAEIAAEKAIKSPLLDNLLLKNAKGLLVNVVASSDFNFEEQDRITQKVQTLVDIDEANIFYGIVFDEDLGDEIQVTVVATGLTLDNSARHDKRGFVSDATSNIKVEQGTHEPAYGTRRDVPPPPPVAPPVSVPAQPAPPQPTQQGQVQPPRTGNSIQDYLRRQQGK